tara:strand:- start:1182 stop:1952 length:771 start_codon:yes stop_codon:yes gene_type:complete
MQTYQEEFAKVLADNNILFFEDNLVLKDGRPTPYFVNIGVFGEKASLTSIMGKYYASMIKEQIDKGLKIDIIFGSSYKGSAIALAAGLSLNQDHNIDLGIIYDRKEAKAHGEGSSAKDLLVGAKMFDNCNILMVDDVISSAATKYESIDKLNDVAKGENININIVGLGIAIDREQTTPVYEDPKDKSTLKLGVKGEDTVKDFTEKSGVPVFFIAKASEVVQYLQENKIPISINKTKQPISEETKKKFDEYLVTYGT